MNTRLEDYGITNAGQDEPKTEKPFTLVKTPDPDIHKILGAKKSVWEDTRLSRAMKNYFVWILDRSLDRNAPGWKGRGKIVVSDGYAAMFHHVTDRTIYTWKKMLDACSHLWLSLDFKTNRDPATLYNITALVPRPPAVRQDDDGCVQNGAGRGSNQFVRRTVDKDGRFDIGHEGQGARTPGQRHLRMPGVRGAKPPGVELVQDENGTLWFPDFGGKLPLSRSFFPGREANDPEKLANSAASRVLLRGRAEENFGSAPKKISAQSRSKDRVSAEENFGREPKRTSGLSRCRPPTRETVT